VSDLSDFMSAHPVPDPPVEKVERDTSFEAFAAARVHATHTPFGGRRSMRLVDPAVCKFDPANDCGHDHAGPIFRPQPDLDEIGVGWTVQHTPQRLDAWKVDKHCVLCWECVSDLREHTCQVAVVLNG
jgi:hypothetical protein